jgi:RNA polymerase sigma-70 factor (ECF subfamily)
MASERDPRRFATTRWSLIVEAADPGSPQAEAALATLCELYWFPVYAFVRRSGRSTDESRDLTQGFFARVLEKGYFKQARQERGRFRSFLLTAVRNFLANEWDAGQAQKRGGGQRILPLDFDDSERRYQLEPADVETPERVYERRWAQTVLGHARDRLRAKFAESGRADLFARLGPCLSGEEPDYGALSAELGMSAGSLRVAVHRLRRQFAATLREAVAETVDRPEEVEEELRHLIAAVGE